MVKAARPTILIAGAGVAGLETLIALRDHLGAMAHIELLDPSRTFTYRPLAVAEPFGRGAVRRFELERIAADHGAVHRLDGLASIDKERRVVRTTHGWEVTWDRLVVAVGSRPHNAVSGAIPFRGPEDAQAFADLLDEAAEGGIARLAIVVPVGVTWSFPAYELALMTGEHLVKRDVATQLVVVTAEAFPLAVFGRDTGDRVARLLADRGVEVVTGVAAEAVEDGRLRLGDGGAVPADRVVTLPRQRGPWIPGLPHDAEGFIPTDRHGAVAGAPRVYAVGDGTTFPIKQGGIAAQQADAAAAAIAADLGAPVEATPFRPVLRGLLLDALAPRYLRTEPRGDRTRDTEFSRSALWWPPSKIAARHLAPYLANPEPHLAAEGPLADRAPEPAADSVDANHREFAELALALADENARWGEFGTALRCLDAVEALDGMLPPGYAGKRREWSGRLRPGAATPGGRP